MTELRDRFRGCLLGLAVGDSIGAAYEGEPESFIYSRFPEPKDLFRRAIEDSLNYTDDTQMTIGVAEALLEDGEIVAATLCRKFVDNYVPARGYGRGARRILEAIEEGRDHERVAEEVFPGGSFGNGAAMRVAPIGLLFFQDLQRCLEQSKQQAVITHRHPVGIEGAQLLAVAVAEVIGSSSLDRSRMLERLLAFSSTPELREKLLAARDIPANRIHELGNGITAQESVVTAIACFLAWPESYQDAIGHVVLLGDTDTIAAMTGALSGAYLGIQAIPSAVLNVLENEIKGRDYLLQLADSLLERTDR